MKNLLYYYNKMAFIRDEYFDADYFSIVEFQRTSIYKEHIHELQIFLNKLLENKNETIDILLKAKNKKLDKSISKERLLVERIEHFLYKFEYIILEFDRVDQVFIENYYLFPTHSDAIRNSYSEAIEKNEQQYHEYLKEFGHDNELMQYYLYNTHPEIVAYIEKNIVELSTVVKKQAYDEIAPNIASSTYYRTKNEEFYRRLPSAHPKRLFIDLTEVLKQYPITTKISQNARYVLPVLDHIIKTNDHVCVPAIYDREGVIPLDIIVGYDRENIQYAIDAYGENLNYHHYYFKQKDTRGNTYYTYIRVQNGLFELFKSSCKNKSLMVIGLGINFDTYQTVKHFGHKNGLIIDLDKKLVERIEPNGPILDLDHPLYNDLMRESLNYFVQKILPDISPKLQSFQYKDIGYSCPIFGPQAKQKHLDKGGFCVAWSALIMHLKIINPDYQLFEINDLLLKKSPEELLDMIQRYVSYMDDIIDKFYPEIREHD
jgi:hypothetical protein